MMSLYEIFNEFIQNLSNIFSNLPEKMSTLFNSPITLLTLFGCILIFLLLMKAKSIKFTPKMLTTIGIAIALSTVLNMLKIYKFPQGGGITLASMIPLLLIAYMYGPLVGMLSGFVFGILSLFLDPYIMHPVQVLFDYPLPYMALGVAGFFKDKKILGAIVAIFCRFIFHFLSGVIFFGSFA
ncbi:MAG: energy-coupled thiamine transporter ThiT, partial [Sarcina sp.]